MVFSDPVFLYFFLPLCLVIYWAGAWRFRNTYLWMAGGIFYLWGGGPFLVVLVASIVGNHLAALHLARLRERAPGRGRWMIRWVVALNLLPLVIWKYGGFAASQAGVLLRSLGADVHPVLHLTLPIAISFYTFQCISYVVDVWRGTAKPAPRLVDFGAYILLFPHLIAGPIVRYAHIEQDLLGVSRRRFEDLAMGAPRFFWGLAKKVMVADQVSAIANQVYALPDNRVTSVVAWLGILAYAVQIYFDFSGYSDMAIGLARMFGFRFPENFDRPYSAVSVTDFWRRWHMSLSSWFRDYLYIPLGGNRLGSTRTYINLSIVFLLTGLWHGANWTFIVWGCFHGLCLIIERATGLGTSALPRLHWPRRLLTFVLVCIGWAIFRADNLGQALALIGAMVFPTGGTMPLAVAEVMTTQRLLWLALGLSVVLFPGGLRVGWIASVDQGRGPHAFRLAISATLAVFAAVYTLSGTFSPFLYFQF